VSYGPSPNPPTYKNDAKHHRAKAAERYRAQAARLVRVLPFVAAEQCFALKGGIAINLFIRVFR